MGMIKEKDKDAIRQRFSEELVNSVELVMFTQEMECQFCQATREILEVVSALNDRVKLSVFDFVADKEKADQLGIDKIPAIAVMGEKDFGVRFYGIPSGYEFTTLIDTIVDVSKGDPGLPDEILKQLAGVTEPIRLEALVTPT